MRRVPIREDTASVATFAGDVAKMLRPNRMPLSWTLLVVPATLLSAQQPAVRDKPPIHVPVHAESKEDVNHREAVKLYGVAVFHERANRLIEAVHALEQAQRLDPDSAAIPRMLGPLYLALDRTDDALAACRRVVELDPGDYQTWYFLARQYRGLEQRSDAIAALERATHCSGLKDRIDLRAQVYFDLAVLREQGQEFAKAEKALREVVAVLDHPEPLTELGTYSREEIDAQAAETYERLGSVRLKIKQFDGAIDAFRKAQQKDPKRSVRLAYNLAEVYQEQGKFTEALRSLDEYLRTQPQSTEAYERRIKLLEKLGREQEILPSLQRAADADKFNIGLKLLLASQYASRGDPRRAETIYQALLKLSPTLDVYRGLLSLYDPQNAQDMDKLLRLLDSALKAAGGRRGEQGSPARAAEARAILAALRDKPQLIGGLLLVARPMLTREGSLSWETRYYLAVLAARTKRLEEAEALYRSCLAGRTRRTEADAYSGLLQVLWQAKKYQQIVEVCQRGLQEARGTSRVLFEIDLARAHLALEQPQQAVEQATLAVEHARDEDRLYCRRLRAQVLSQAERHEEAIKECEGLLREYKQVGDIRDIRYTLSGIYTAAKKVDQAAEQLQLILEQDPSDATANNDLGYLWADEGKNLEEAEKHIRKALDLDRHQRTAGTAVGPDSDRDNAAYIDSLGWVLFRRGKLEQARQELEKAAGLPDGQEDPVVWDHLGDVAFRQNDAERARQAWRKAVELYEEGRRRKADDRYKELQRKLKLLHE
jgi:tetratricopeptide (TPR) repeat protein